MKKIIFTLFACSLLCFGTRAQTCGNSGPSICTPDTNVLKTSGFYPATDSSAPFYNDTNYSMVIEFKNFDTVPGVQYDPIQALVIDSINNLPSGLCWATNKANNSFARLESGCIVLSGTVCSTPGQYSASIWVTINGFGPINLAQENPPVFYYLRVRNAGDTITPVDTSSKAAFVHYGTEVASSCTTGFNEIATPASSLTIIPNPVTSSAAVNFTSVKSALMTEKITNIIGAQVHSVQRDVKAGNNTFTIQRNDLPPGVYFYSIGDGVNVVTKRMVIAE